MRKTLALLSLSLLAGCVSPSPQHVNALNAMIGKSETDVVRGYGVPTKSYDTGGLKFLAYNMSRIDTIPGSGFGYGGYGWGGGGWGGGWSYGGFGGFPPEVVQRDCATTFELKAGIVQRWSLRGDDC